VPVQRIVQCESLKGVYNGGMPRLPFLPRLLDALNQLHQSFDYFPMWTSGRI
jgi:hypothetical protein